MKDPRETQLSDSLRNMVTSFQMEGMTVSEAMQEMLLSVLRGERTLDECLAQVNAKYGG